jgi:hypothetical protein
MHYMLAIEIAELFLGFLIKPSKPHHSLVKEQPRHNLTAVESIASAFGFSNFISTTFPAKHG